MGGLCGMSKSQENVDVVPRTRNSQGFSESTGSNVNINKAVSKKKSDDSFKDMEEYKSKKFFFIT